jgi:hypothetical protein
VVGELLDRLQNHLLIAGSLVLYLIRNLRTCKDWYRTTSLSAPFATFIVVMVLNLHRRLVSPKLGSSPWQGGICAKRNELSLVGHHQSNNRPLSQRDVPVQGASNGALAVYGTRYSQNGDGTVAVQAAYCVGHTSRI